MKRRVVGLAVVGVAGLVGTSALAAPTAYTRPGETSLASRSSSGVQGDGESFRPWINRDGTCLSFESKSKNLVKGASTGAFSEVFVRDLRRGVTSLASIASDGSRAVVASTSVLPYGSGYSSISDDCRYVAFWSDAINLVPSDTNLTTDIFVHDMRTGSTRRVSVSSTNTQANGRAQWSMISGDGRYVVFATDASNMIANDTNNAQDVFVRDLRTSKTTLVSVATSGKVGNGSSGMPSISRDGRFISFRSTANNLTSQATAGDNIFVRDMRTGRTVQVSVATDGSQPTFGSMPSCTLSIPPLISLPVLGDVGGGYAGLCDNDGGHRTISDDGRFVVYMSNASNLVPNDANYSPATNGWDVFVYDLWLHRTQRVSVDPYGHERTDIQRSPFDGAPSISGDGRVVAYSSSPTSLLCSQNTSLGALANSASLCTYPSDLFAHDLLSGADEHVSVTPAGGQAQPGTCGPVSGIGQASLSSTYPTLSGSGERIAYYSSATNLTAGDSNRNCDVFVRDRGSAVGARYGSGTGTTGGGSGCLISAPICLPPMPAAVAGKALVDATLVARPNLKDLYLTWDLRGLPTVTGSAPTAGNRAVGTLYGLQFGVGGATYEVRAQRVLGADYDRLGGASFGLFRESLPGAWTKVAALKGGYGTVGEAVVTAVPLSLLGGKAQLTEVTAYTAVGSYLSGPTKILDSLRLSR